MVAGSNLQRSKVIGLDFTDYDPISGQIRITDKGSKPWTSNIVNGAADAHADWLTAQEDHPGSAFMPINTGGLKIIQQMTSKEIETMINKGHISLTFRISTLTIVGNHPSTIRLMLAQI